MCDSACDRVAHAPGCVLGVLQRALVDDAEPVSLPRRLESVAVALETAAADPTTASRLENDLCNRTLDQDGRDTALALAVRTLQPQLVAGLLLLEPSIVGIDSKLTCEALRLMTTTTTTAPPPPPPLPQDTRAAENALLDAASGDAEARLGALLQKARATTTAQRQVSGVSLSALRRVVLRGVDQEANGASLYCALCITLLLAHFGRDTVCVRSADDSDEDDSRQLDGGLDVLAPWIELGRRDAWPADALSFVTSALCARVGPLPPKVGPVRNPDLFLAHWQANRLARQSSAEPRNLKSEGVHHSNGSLRRTVLVHEAHVRDADSASTATSRSSNRTGSGDSTAPLLAHTFEDEGGSSDSSRGSSRGSIQASTTGILPGSGNGGQDSLFPPQDPSATGRSASTITLSSQLSASAAQDPAPAPAPAPEHSLNSLNSHLYPANPVSTEPVRLLGSPHGSSSGLPDASRPNLIIPRIASALSDAAVEPATPDACDLDGLVPEKAVAALTKGARTPRSSPSSSRTNSILSPEMIAMATLKVPPRGPEAGPSNPSDHDTVALTVQDSSSDPFADESTGLVMRSPQLRAAAASSTNGTLAAGALATLGAALLGGARSPTSASAQPASSATLNRKPSIGQADTREVFETTAARRESEQEREEMQDHIDDRFFNEVHSSTNLLEEAMLRSSRRRAPSVLRPTHTESAIPDDRHERHVMELTGMPLAYNTQDDDIEHGGSHHHHHHHDHVDSIFSEAPGVPRNDSAADMQHTPPLTRGFSSPALAEQDSLATPRQPRRVVIQERVEADASSHYDTRRTLNRKRNKGTEDKQSAAYAVSLMGRYRDQWLMQLLRQGAKDGDDSGLPHIPKLQTLDPAMARRMTDLLEHHSTSGHHTSRSGEEVRSIVSFVSDARPRLAESHPRYTIMSQTNSTRTYADLSELLSHNPDEVLSPGGQQFWIDVHKPTKHDMRMMEHVFNLHPLTTEDVLSDDTREKLEVYDNYLFICLHSYSLNEMDYSLNDNGLVFVCLFANYVITFHDVVSPPITRVYQRLKRKASHVRPDWVVYFVLDEIVELHGPPVDVSEAEVESIDDLVVTLSGSEQADFLRRTGQARKRLTDLYRRLHPKREILSSLLSRPMPHVSKNTMLYFRDVFDHVLGLMMSLEVSRETLNTAQSQYLGKVSIEVAFLSNEIAVVMKRLTYGATVLLPLTLVAGIFGMNIYLPFQLGSDQPLSDTFWPFIFVMLFMAVLSFSIVYLVRRMETRLRR
ncbi:hypothetical protein CAOG_02211 [Capsaspora owczarzaki ATCC 30864]|uniref:Uncharacterized protein n=1 Tax=Capsaspora owczarzaki (strain ATCC 30864) TaxID=595528 RepID=A0A0D2VLK4_CAPO3|nr:hypothetical protein CAOG_02211 [Capsaspora owczarzaki ATCC 30864]KJE91002.1 hypothetical protein CAOG_002211 [Capsaspora owczarzaki ATCC 30864]|eukprot:XP_004348961.2 hypothetical protein CAOG_02211 [Capsaspora owczarzaki ATCC 30864]